MAEWLNIATEWAVHAIDAMALIVILFGTVEAFIGTVRLIFTDTTATQRRHVWLNFSRWLVAGLTFQLAADILETSIAPSWDDIGQLGAIALIRTFLNFFLERDMFEINEKQHPENGAALKSRSE